MNYYNVNWDMINYATTIILNKLKDFNIDLIVPIARGGLVPGTMIAYKAGIKNIYPLHLCSYTDDNQQENIRFVTKPDLEYLVSNFMRKNILVFDDLSDTGNTLNYVLKFFDYNLNAANVKTATLYIKPHTGYIPDIYVSEFSNDTWVVFPWE